MKKRETISIVELAEVNPKVDLSQIKDNTVVSFIPMSDVTENGHWETRQERYFSNVRIGYTPFAENDVLFAKITPCMENGKGAHVVGLKNKVGFGSTEFHVLRVRGKNSARFLFHCLQDRTTRMRAIAYMGGSAGQQRVQSDFFNNFRVLKLEEVEQTCIAEILDTVDEAISKTEAVIAKLQRIRSGLLHDFLTRGLDANGQFRDPIAHPEQFKDSPIGRIPKEWVVKPLSELCSHIGSGVTPRGGQDVYTSTGVMLIRSQNVTFGGLLLDDVAYIPEDIHLGMLRSEVFAHDVLFNITGASIGRCCPAPDGLGIANVNQHVCILRVSEANVFVAKYLSLVLSSSIGQRQLEALNTMGNRQGLNYQQLGAFVIPWPMIGGELEAIVSKIIAIENQVLVEKAEYEKLKDIKSGLTTDLLTGRVRVPAGKSHE